jgi:hypothetical protein
MIVRFHPSLCPALSEVREIRALLELSASSDLWRTTRQGAGLSS